MISFNAWVWVVMLQLVSRLLKCVPSKRYVFGRVADILTDV